MHRLSKSTGFTLIELMIVVVIIGILAALAVPRFMQATTKSKQTEARSILKQIYTNQRAYRQQVESANTYYQPAAPLDSTNRFAFEDIWIELGPPARYQYTMVTNPTGFTCTATAQLDDDPAVDIWTIDDSGNLTCVNDDATATN